MFFLEQIFGFGKYSGLTLKQVYQGTGNISVDLMNSYIKYVLENDEDAFSKIQPLNTLMAFEVNDSIINIKPFRNNVKGNFSNRIEQLFALRNNPLDRTYIDTLDNFNVKNYSVNRSPIELAGGNPEYIYWCLKNVDEFFVSPLEELFSLDVNRFRGIKVAYIEENVYEYKTINEVKKLELSKTIIELNQKKSDLFSEKYYEEDSPRTNGSNRDYFDAMTDGQLGSYDDFEGSADDIDNWAGR
jgi:hypothetical protein